MNFEKGRLMQLLTLRKIEKQLLVLCISLSFEPIRVVLEIGRNQGMPKMYFNSVLK